jgi:uncharacterized damage-inducible protein DinB
MKTRKRIHEAQLMDREKTLHRSVTYSWPRARARSRPLWHILQPIVNHGTHHRSEIGCSLETMGLSPKDLDFIKFVANTKQE